MDDWADSTGWGPDVNAGRLDAVMGGLTAVHAYAAADGGTVADVLADAAADLDYIGTEDARGDIAEQLAVLAAQPEVRFYGADEGVVYDIDAVVRAASDGLQVLDRHVAAGGCPLPGDRRVRAELLDRVADAAADVDDPTARGEVLAAVALVAEMAGLLTAATAA